MKLCNVSRYFSVKKEESMKRAVKSSAHRFIVF